MWMDGVEWRERVGREIGGRNVRPSVTTIRSRRLAHLGPRKLEVPSRYTSVFSCPSCFSTRNQALPNREMMTGVEERPSSRRLSMPRPWRSFSATMLLPIILIARSLALPATTSSTANSLQSELSPLSPSPAPEDLQPSPPSPSSPTTDDPGRWLISNLGGTCTNACYNEGLVCDNDLFYLHNGEIASVDLQSGVLTALLGRSCTDYTLEYGSEHNVPAFAPLGLTDAWCAISAADRPPDSFECNSTNGADQQRVCYCGLPPPPPPPLPGWYAGNAGASCTSTCSEQYGLACIPPSLPYISTSSTASSSNRP